MALLVVQTNDGGSALVHSSIFDPPVWRETPPAREAAWRAVWRRLDAARGTHSTAPHAPERKENTALDSAPARRHTAAVDKHPRDMTDAELRSLPTVNRFAGEAVRTFEGPGGSRWAVGRSGSIWVKARVPPSERTP